MHDALDFHLIFQNHRDIIVIQEKVVLRLYNSPVRMFPDNDSTDWIQSRAKDKVHCYYKVRVLLVNIIQESSQSKVRKSL